MGDRLENRADGHSLVGRDDLHVPCNATVLGLGQGEVDGDEREHVDGLDHILKERHECVLRCPRLGGQWKET